MDNVTHTLVGAVLAEAGLKRWTPLAAPTLLLAANFPDIDIVVGLSDRLTYLEHHRGITHAIVAIPLLSLLLAGLMQAGSRWWQRRHPKHQRARFWPLFWLGLISMSTHPLLDFTNSYGWRPFLPWNHTWFYGDIDFVADPWLWVGLGGTMVLGTATTRARLLWWGVLFAVLAVPVLLFGGIAWSLKIGWLSLVWLCFFLRTALSLNSTSAELLMRGVVVASIVYFGTLTWLQHRTLRELQFLAPQLVQPDEQITKVDALPLPGNPFLRQGVISTNKAFYFFASHLLSFNLSSTSFQASRIIQREIGDPTAIMAALREPELQAFLRFARFPVISTSHQPNQITAVEIRDVRFELDSRAVSTFQASVLLDAQLRRIVE
jgi:inner membrane protein